MQLEEEKISIHQNNDDDVAVKQAVIMTNKKLPLKLNKEFGEFLKLKFNKNEDAITINEQREFEIIFQLGLIESKRRLFSGESALLHKGKKPRNDVWERLGRIAKEFLNCSTYPIIPNYAFSNLLNKALGKKDLRVIRDYRKTVLLYCRIDEEIIDNCSDSRLGELDVAFFVSLIPKQFIAASSTSSFSTPLPP